jgi:CheY-like chemotaxis protein
LSWSGSAGKNAMTAKKGFEAIEKLKPDLVFLDIEMPVMNGFELLETVQTNSVFQSSSQPAMISMLLKPFALAPLDYLLKLLIRRVDQRYKKSAGTTSIYH